jgi:hypothetical protein
MRLHDAHRVVFASESSLVRTLGTAALALLALNPAQLSANDGKRRQL